LLGPGPRLIKKKIYRAAVTQRLRNTALEHTRNGITSVNVVSGKRRDNEIEKIRRTGNIQGSKEEK